MAIPEKKPYEQLSKYLERVLPGELEAGKSRGKATADIIAKFNAPPKKEMFAPFIIPSKFGFANSATGSAGGGDADADAYIAAVTTAGGTLSGAEETAIQTFYTDLKTAGVYSQLICMYPFMGGTAGSHAIDGINPGGSYDLTFFGGWTHSSSGAKSNGTNAYANTNFNPEALSIAWDNFHGGYYNTFNNSTGGERYAFGALDRSGTDKWIAPRIMSATTERMNFGGADDTYTIPVTQIGQRLVYGDGTSTFKIRLDGTEVGFNTYAFTTPNANLNLYIGCMNFNGSDYGHVENEYIFTHFGNSLTSTQATDLETAINDLQTSLGRNTY